MPRSVTVNPQGDIYILDTEAGHDNRIVHVREAGAPPSVVPPPVVGRSVNVREVRGQVLVAVPAGSARASADGAGVEGGAVRADHRGAPDPGRVVARHAQGDGAADLRARLQGHHPERRLRRRGVPGAAVARREGEGPDRAATQGRRASRTAPAAPNAPATAQRSQTPPRGGCRGARSAACAQTPRAASAPAGATPPPPSAAPAGPPPTAATARSPKSPAARVTVRDLRRRKNITLRTGKSYLAKARR